jgi:pantoate--beta-alanine ligase
VKSVRTVAQLRAELAPARRAGLEVGLVPTMGALHAGHLSLIERAREQCDFVVVSLFVNPAQFDEDADLERYPRREQADARLAAAAGADLLFAPAAAEVYPGGFASTVEVRGVGERLEGEARGAEHFRGVSTVVTKLLCMTQPAVAYFGQKDAQQVAVIRRLVEDLNLPVRIEALPIVREADGLAMSSRNALLSAQERGRARALPDALRHAQALVEEGERSSVAIRAAVHAQLRQAGLRADYVALVDPVSFEELPALSEQALLLIAAHVGSVRLIDNALLGARIGLGAAPAAHRDAEHAGEVAPCSA